MKRNDGTTTLEILLEDNHLLAVNKPSGLPSQPDASGDASLDVLAREYIRVKYAKPGEAYLALLHRLDRPTSGVVLMARTGKAAGRMAEAFRRREVSKRYLAVVECATRPERSAECRDWLAPAGNGGMRRVDGKTPDSREAGLVYRLAAELDGGRRALLEIDLLTGVKHQIRCQLAARGLPVAGDHRYGALGKTARPRPVAGGRAILLHARRVGFVHPVRREPAAVVAPLPEHWRAPLADLGGDWPEEVGA